MESTCIRESVNQKSVLQNDENVNECNTSTLAPGLPSMFGANKENTSSLTNGKPIVQGRYIEEAGGIIKTSSRANNGINGHFSLVQLYPPHFNPMMITRPAPPTPNVPPEMEQTIQIPKNAVIDQEDPGLVGNGVKKSDSKRESVVFNVQYKQFRNEQNEDKVTMTNMNTNNTMTSAMISSDSSSLDHDAKTKETVSTGSASYDESKYESDEMDDAQTVEPKAVENGVEVVNAVNAVDTAAVGTTVGAVVVGTDSKINTITMHSVNSVNGKVGGNTFGAMSLGTSSLITNALPPMKKPPKTMPPWKQLGRPKKKRSSKPISKHAERVLRARNKNKPCRYHGGAQGCKWGDDCYFNHENPKKVQLCPRYKTKKGCSWGKECWDRHDDGTQPVDDPTDRIKKCIVVPKGKKNRGDEEKHGDCIPPEVTQEDEEENESEIENENTVKPLEPHQTRQMTIFERIDQGLAAYYKICGREDYFNEEGNGKFNEFANANALDEHHVEMELEYATTNSNCSLGLVDIDDDFPFPPEVSSKHKSTTDRNNGILKVIGSCSKFGSYAVLSCCEGTEFGLYTETEMKCIKHSDGRFECDRIDRMIDALIYVSKMDIGNREDDRKLFKQFVEETYVSLLEDYCHVFKEHDNLEELQILAQLKPEAFRSLNSCRVHNCYYALSKATEYGHYFRDSEYLRKMNTDPDDASFWWDLMDSMHCLLFHLYDMGIRIKYTDGRNRSKGAEEETWKEQHARTQRMMKWDDPNFHFVRYCQFGQLGVYIFAQPYNEDALGRTTGSVLNSGDGVTHTVRS